MKKAYPKYKETRILWVKVVPSHWKVIKGKYVLVNKKELNTSWKSLNRLALTLNGVVNRKFDDNEGLSPSDFSTYQLFQKDDLVFKLIDLENIKTSRVGLVHEDGIMSSAYIRLTIPKSGNDPKFFYYLFYDWYQQNIFNFLGSGVRATLTSSDLLELFIYCPPLLEQRQIASFLDYKCDLIDTFIQKKTRLIELLKEQKQAIINKAVTKGIDPNVRLKPSGIDWLGDIPEHWEVKKLKYVLNEVSIRSDDGVGTLLMVSQEHGIVERAKFHEKSEVAQTTVGHKKCRKNDLVFNKLKAHLGVFFKTNYDGLVSPDYAVYRAKDGMDVLFFEFLFRHPAYIYQFISKITGIVEGLMRLYTSDLFSIKVALPSKNEMADILAFIDGESNKIFKTISRIEREINLLHEYKTTLITEAVTGKIDVRDWKPKERSLPIETSTVATP